MKKFLILSVSVAALALVGCGKKEEAAAPKAEAPKVEAPAAAAPVGPRHGHRAALLPAGERAGLAHRVIPFS